MSIYAWREERPKKSSSRYSADDYSFHRNKEASYAPCVEGHIWLPPADFADYLADDAHRLVVFAEESFDDEYSIYDTRNWDAYTTTSGEFGKVAKRLYEIAAAKFKHALAKDLDLDLSEATIRYWSDRMVIKWGDISVNFHKPSSWELYNGFEKIGTASDLDTLRALTAARGTIPRGNDGVIPRNYRNSSSGVHCLETGYSPRCSAPAALWFLPIIATNMKNSTTSALGTRKRCCMATLG